MSATVEAISNVNDVDELLDDLTAGGPKFLSDLATDLAKAISEVALVLTLRDDAEVDEHAIIEGVTGFELDELETWVADVLATTAERGDLRANGGPLLVLPECLREFFDLEQPDDAADGSSESQDSSSDVPKAETRAEAKLRLEGLVHSLRSMYSEATVEFTTKDKAAKAAKKAQESILDEFLAAVTELDEINHGGAWQKRLPLDRTSENSSAPGCDSNSGTATGSASGTSQCDEAIGWAVHVLTVDQLTEKTSGQSDGKGISEAIADKLVDNHINTIGELESHMRQHSVYWFRPLKGIGEGKADAILDAVNALRRVYPQAGGE